MHVVSNWGASTVSNYRACVFTVAQPSITDQQIRNIKHHELKYDDVKKPFMVTANTEVYKGEFSGFPVAIKRYVDPLNISQRSVTHFITQRKEIIR